MGDEGRGSKTIALLFGKIISWNVRGLNDWGKCMILRGCLARWKPKIVCFQETKMDEYTDEVIKSLWREADVGWYAIPDRGLAGGIIIM